MYWKSPDLPSADLASEISDINGEFLRLLTHPSISDAPGALGLPAEILDRLWQLTPTQLSKLAALPVLLPEFEPFPAFSGVRDAEPVASEAPLSKTWQTEKHDFVTRLLTCLWQGARQSSWRTCLYAGISSRQCRILAELSFSSLSRCTCEAAGRLRVRLCDHPHYWPDLLRSLQAGSSSQQIASSLAVIPLSVASQWSPAERKSAAIYL